MTARLLSYPETEALLQRYGLNLMPAELVTTRPAALQAAARLGYPLALKAISPAQTHKTDAGLLALQIQTPAQLKTAWRDLTSRLAGLPLEGILVQKMAGRGVEVLVGIQVDPQFGPVVALGLGGALVHLIDEVSLRLPPVTALEVQDILAETRLGRLLAGVRGAPPSDLPALVKLVRQVGNLAAAGLPLASLDLNPVIVHPAGQGLSLVDVRLFVEGEIP